MTTLHPRQRAILTHLWKHPRASFRGLMGACHISSAAPVAWHLGRLNHLGYINPRPKGTARTRTLTSVGLLAAQGYEILFWEPARHPRWLCRGCKRWLRSGDYLNAKRLP